MSAACSATIAELLGVLLGVLLAVIFAVQIGELVAVLVMHFANCLRISTGAAQREHFKQPVWIATGTHGSIITYLVKHVANASAREMATCAAVCCIPCAFIALFTIVRTASKYACAPYCLITMPPYSPSQLLMLLVVLSILLLFCGWGVTPSRVIIIVTLILLLQV